MIVTHVQTVPSHAVDVDFKNDPSIPTALVADPPIDYASHLEAREGFGLERDAWDSEICAGCF